MFRLFVETLPLCQKNAFSGISKSRIANAWVAKQYLLNSAMLDWDRH